MVELIICNNDGMAEGAISALQTAGYNNERRQPRTIPVFGVDATDSAKAADQRRQHDRYHQAGRRGHGFHHHHPGRERHKRRRPDGQHRSASTWTRALPRSACLTPSTRGERGLIKLPAPAKRPTAERGCPRRQPRSQPSPTGVCRLGVHLRASA